MLCLWLFFKAGYIVIYGNKKKIGNDFDDTKVTKLHTVYKACVIGKDRELTASRNRNRYKIVII